jgi:uncharacterized protein YuzB (UPF0349 family)
MSQVIEYCCCNRDLKAEFGHLDSEIELDGRRCLEHCGICRTQDFAVIDGQLRGMKAVLKLLRNR